MEPVLRPRRHHDLVRFVCQPVLGAQFGSDRQAKIGKAGGIAVAGEPFLHGGVRRLDDVGRRRDAGLAEAERVDAPPRLLELARLGGETDGAGDGEAVDAALARGW